VGRPTPPAQETLSCAVGDRQTDQREVRTHAAPHSDHVGVHHRCPGG